MPQPLPEILAKTTTSGYVIAPAGFGKTHLIASSIKLASSRQLILTHTYAGVDSLKKKLRNINVESSLFQVDTIASWALKMCLSYPNRSGWSKEFPQSSDWNDVYKACRKLLNSDFAIRVIKNSYTGVYIDEYQDCSETQHDLILGLVECLPCRIVGDPLQSIFDFSDKPVCWERDIYPNFLKFGELTIPWRWKNSGTHELGDWLVNIRADIENEQAPQLPSQLPEGMELVKIDIHDFTVEPRKRFSSFYKSASQVGSSIVIFSGNQRSKNKSHKLAQSLSGRFTSIEEVEGKVLASAVENIEKAKSSKNKLITFFEFLKKCMTGIAGELTAPTKRGEVAKISSRTKNKKLTELSNSFLAHPTSDCMLKIVSEFESQAQVQTYRRDLLNRFKGVLKLHNCGEGAELTDSLELYRQVFRHSGRPLKCNKQIGTTLLVKGLEYDHCIVINPKEMTSKELYVALTRGSKTLCIIHP
ncbi:hypothetical protein BCT07_10850 [Vibrio breoganii]|uniref:UvrD-helicase domain-containing protein n=1 Tax=Vibrio breoganii TaxID=553239 RepID=UPI000C84D348|nr:UvrD-helicase domain-containing protein [Vibrio breoganii]PMO58744.1 hypothetical protein BCT07_10850 [Vibrio breoganii]